MTDRGFLVALAPEHLSPQQRTGTKYEEAGPKTPCGWGVVGDRIVVYGPIQITTDATADAIGLVDERGKLLTYWAMRPGWLHVPAGSTITKEGEPRPEGRVALEAHVS